MVTGLTRTWGFPGTHGRKGAPVLLLHRKLAVPLRSNRVPTKVVTFFFGWEGARALNRKMVRYVAKNLYLMPDPKSSSSESILLIR